jgi:hypothetical protein
MTKAKPARQEPQPVPTSGPQPSPAVTERLTHRERRNLQRPWQASEADFPGLPRDQIEDLRVHENELIGNEASEFSIGKGMEPPWVTRNAARQGRYATPAEGGRYHGKAPSCGPTPTPICPNRHGSVQLGKALRRCG